VNFSHQRLKSLHGASSQRTQDVIKNRKLQMELFFGNVKQLQTAASQTIVD
jgi:hypothetical protein